MILNASRKDAPVKQVQKRFNPDEIRATEISLGNPDGIKEKADSIGQAGQAKTQRVIDWLSVIFKVVSY